MSLLDARKELAALLLKEEQYWKQRSKIFWLIGDDLNTKNFHQTASARHKANKILGLFYENNNWVSSKSEREGVISRYFMNLFTPSENPENVDEVMNLVRGRILVEDNNHLTRDFDAKEFRDAIFQMHNDKSPGPDNFNPGFYKRFWELVGPNIVRTGVQWLESGCFPPELNNTNVVLVPKCDQPKRT